MWECVNASTPQSIGYPQILWQLNVFLIGGASTFGYFHKMEVDSRLRKCFVRQHCYNRLIRRLEVRTIVAKLLELKNSVFVCKYSKLEGTGEERYVE